MVKAKIEANSNNRAVTGLATRVSGISDELARRIATDLRDAIVRNLTEGGGSTGLASAGYGRPVRRGQGFRHVATGATLNSIQLLPARRGYSRVWTVSVGGAARVLNYGRRPGAPVPVEQIERWLAIKGIRAKRGIGGRSVLAKRLATKIQARGMAPTYFYTDAERFIRGRLRNNFYRLRGGK
jgi:hypothetical protein